jgi:hypothetical protein
VKLHTYGLWMPLDFCNIVFRLKRSSSIGNQVYGKHVLPQEQSSIILVHPVQNIRRNGRGHAHHHHNCVQWSTRFIAPTLPNQNCHHKTSIFFPTCSKVYTTSIILIFFKTKKENLQNVKSKWRSGNVSLKSSTAPFHH